jgi:hypothetical protein
MLKLPHEKQLIDFTPDDFHFLDTVLRLSPELRICALALKRAKETKLTFPINSHHELMKLMPQEQLQIEGHFLDAEHIEIYMPKVRFPIRDEAALARRIYMGLLRCRQDHAWASSAPANFRSILAQHEAPTSGEG